MTKRVGGGMKAYERTRACVIGVFLVASATGIQPIAAHAEIGIWTSAAELAGLPTSGAAWEAVLSAANSSTSNPDVTNQEDPTNINVLAAGIVFARTGNIAYKNKVVVACDSLSVAGNPGGRTLAWGREVGAYALAADLVGYRTTGFETWLRNIADHYIASDGRTLRRMFEIRANNWGAHGFGSLCAIYRYLGDTAALARIRDYWVRGVTGPNPGFSFGDLAWQADAHDPRLINPRGATKLGADIDGVIPDDQRRGGAFVIPPGPTNYPWEFLQGQIMAARILERAGISIWDVGDRALYRAAYCLQVRFAGAYGESWAASADDEWMLPFLDKAYGTNWSRGQSRLWGAGKNAGFGYVTGASSPPSTQVSLTITTVGSGTVAVNPPGGRYPTGTLVTLTAKPALGWTFGSWTGSVGGVANPIHVSMTGNRAVTANFVRNASTLELRPTRDAYVRAGVYANTNYNADAKLRVANKPGDEFDRRAFLQFDLSGVQGSFTSAKLLLQCIGLPNGGPSRIFLHGVYDDRWTEGAITWSNAPAPGSMIEMQEIAQTGSAYVFDVSGFIATQVVDRVATFVLMDDDGIGVNVDFGSRESVAPPLLLLTSGNSVMIEKSDEPMAAAPPRQLSITNGPNPFNPTTRIAYHLPEAGPVTLAIFDVRGRRVAELVHEVQPAGDYERVWQAVDGHGKAFSSGMYLAVLETSTERRVLKMLVAR